MAVNEDDDAVTGILMIAMVITFPMGIGILFGAGIGWLAFGGLCGCLLVNHTWAKARAKAKAAQTGDHNAA